MGSDAEVCAQLARRYLGEMRSLAADKGYGSNWLRDALRDLGIRPLVKYREFAPYVHAQNARSADDFYNQRLITEPANSSVKRSNDSAVRAREW